MVTLYTLWQLVSLHEYVPGRRFNRYHELGQYAFGELCLLVYGLAFFFFILVRSAGLVFILSDRLEVSEEVKPKPTVTHGCQETVSYKPVLNEPKRLERTLWTEVQSAEGRNLGGTGVPGLAPVN